MAYTWRLGDQLPREEDVVYFSGDSSAHSWAGIIGDEHDMTDDEVNKYIKNAKPELFEDLRGMRFGSSDIPLTFKPFLDFRRLDSNTNQVNKRSPTVHRSANPPDKRIVPIKVQQSRPQLPEYAYDQNTRTYEDGLQHDRENQPGRMQDQLKLDGVAQSTILAAAERLYPQIAPAEVAPAGFRDKKAGQDSAFKHPPNSQQALDLRALKQLEINETLAEVSKCERALEAARSQLRQLSDRDPSPDASVLITRQPYMESQEHRYKKQGLTRYDQDKYRRLMRKNESSGIVAPPPTPQKALPATPQFYCYCREPASSSEMIRCSKEWCPIGWFHAQCTGLYRLPYVNEEFYCAYCSDDAILPVASNESDKESDNSSEILEELADTVEQGYLDNEIDTEFIFEESPRQSKTKVPGQVSIYEDGVEGSDTADLPTKAIRQQARLHDKIMRWKAVNERTPEEAIKRKRPVMREIENQPCGTHKAKSFYQESSDFDEDSAQENQTPASDTSTLRVSSSVVPSSDVPENDTDVAGYDDETEFEEEETDYDEQDDTDSDNQGSGVEVGPYTTLTSSARPYDVHAEHEANWSDRPLPTYATTIAASHPSSYFSADLRPLVSAQPSTITNTTVRKNYNCVSCTSTLSSFRSNLPSHLTSLNRSFSHSAYVPRTPTLAPRSDISRPKNPWGTPINIGDYVPEYSPIVEPTSPSPASKRKFSEIESEQEEDSEHEDEQEDENSDEEAYREGWGEDSNVKVHAFQIQQEEDEIDSDEEAYREGWGEVGCHNVTTFKTCRSVRYL